MINIKGRVNFLFDRCLSAAASVCLTGLRVYTGDPKAYDRPAGLCTCPYRYVNQYASEKIGYWIQISHIISTNEDMHYRQVMSSVKMSQTFIITSEHVRADESHLSACELHHQ